MNKCPITYLPCGTARYSSEGLRLLDKSLNDLQDFPFSAPEQRREASFSMSKMSIQGVQPKLSTVLDKKAGVFKIVVQKGNFIIKPQHEGYLQMPENEDLTMKMASLVGIEVPLHGMIWCKDGSLSYFIQRFDREGKKTKLATEDFAQLAGLSRDTKYDYTLEKVIKLLDAHCTFPAVEKLKFFRLILFCFLTGNEDMHLKNFTLITRQGKVELSPAYDLINSTLVLDGAEEEMALMLAGKRKEFRYRELVTYFGLEKLQLSPKVVEATLQNFESKIPACLDLIQQSFLNEDGKKFYRELLSARSKRLLKQREF
jgi:serine/threonine-protein kinase HipA